VAESAKKSKKYPGMKNGMTMTAKMARGTVNPETRRKRAAAEAKRQAASEGAGGGIGRGKRVVKNKPKGGGQRGAEGEQRGSTVSYSRRGGQEMPTAAGPKAPKKGVSRRGSSGDTPPSGGGPISAKSAPVSVHDPKKLARAHVGLTRGRKPGAKKQAADPSQEGIRSGPPTKSTRPKGKKPTRKPGDTGSWQ